MTRPTDEAAKRLREWAQRADDGFNAADEAFKARDEHATWGEPADRDAALRWHWRGFMDGADWQKSRALAVEAERDALQARAVQALALIAELAQAKTDAAENVRRLWQIADTARRWDTAIIAPPVAILNDKDHA